MEEAKTEPRKSAKKEAKEFKRESGIKEKTSLQEQKIKEQGQKLDPKDAQIQELTNLVKKIQADFENYKKRVEKEKSEFCMFASSELVKKLLPLLDSFQLALNNNNDPEEFKKGVELIYSQLWQVLSAEGLKPINAFGKQFDPFLHEVLVQEESDKPENTVLEELQKGYMLHNAVVRPARVKIAKKKQQKEERKKEAEKK